VPHLRAALFAAVRWESITLTDKGLPLGFASLFILKPNIFDPYRGAGCPTFAPRVFAAVRWESVPPTDKNLP
jgi:hypothetical protein